MKYEQAPILIVNDLETRKEYRIMILEKTEGVVMKIDFDGIVLTRDRLDVLQYLRDKREI